MQVMSPEGPKHLVLPNQVCCRAACFTAVNMACPQYCNFVIILLCPWTFCADFWPCQAGSAPTVRTLCAAVKTSHMCQHSHPTRMAVQQPHSSKQQQQQRRQPQSKLLKSQPQQMLQVQHQKELVTSMHQQQRRKQLCRQA